MFCFLIQLSSLLYITLKNNAQILDYGCGTGFIAFALSNEPNNILGMDNYIDFYNQNSAGVTLANQKLQMISDLAVQKNKIAALTETGYSSSNTTPRTAAHFTDLVFPAITNNNIKISYINFWSNNQDNYFVPTPATPYATDFKNFTLKPKMTLQNNIGTSLYLLQ